MEKGIRGMESEQLRMGGGGGDSSRCGAWRREELRMGGVGRG
jgi:hypothetical protein